MAKRIPVSFTTLAVAKQLTTTNPNYELITFLIKLRMIKD